MRAMPRTRAARARAIPARTRRGACSRSSSIPTDRPHPKRNTGSSICPRATSARWAGGAGRDECAPGAAAAMVKISNNVSIPAREIEISAIRAQGAGGQNVNKVSSAIHLRFDIGASSIPDLYKERLLKLKDQRINKEGVVVIKAQQHRSQEMNKEEALRRLQELIKSIAVSPKKRKPTKPTRSSQRKRLDSKTKHGAVKLSRAKVAD